ncbi:MAG: META domain-containing protein [Dysgonamonadaceae bacterium]|jgi:heat shock protein HslJ|nr:META domain-containing protein [Dysgonamonadaceae bacterium]
MKKFVLVMGILSLVIGFNACKGKKQENQVVSEAIDAAHNSRNSLNWDGVYTGVIPCADCVGIRTKVILNTDNTYTVIREYIDKENGFYSYSGEIVWSEDGSDIILKEDERESATKFKVGENILMQLDKEGNIITGDLTDNYVLVKANPDLVGKRWKLVELSGEPVNSDQVKEAFIIFKSDDNVVTGNAGCNNINGTYWLGTNNGISFSPMTSTLMMCLNMDVENNFKKALEATESYSFKEDTLVLEGETAPLARFVEVIEE